MAYLGPTPSGVQHDKCSMPGHLHNVTYVTVGRRFALALKSDATVWGWGSNLAGELGQGNTGNTQCIAVMVTDHLVDPTGFLSGVTAVSAGEYYSLALKNDGSVWTWGGSNLVAVQVVDSQDPGGYLTGVSKITAGADFNLALKLDGSLWRWSNNLYEQLDMGTTDSNSHSVPAQVLGL